MHLQQQRNHQTPSTTGTTTPIPRTTHPHHGVTPPPQPNPTPPNPHPTPNPHHTATAKKLHQRREKTRQLKSTSLEEINEITMKREVETAAHAWRQNTPHPPRTHTHTHTDTAHSRNTRAPESPRPASTKPAHTRTTRQDTQAGMMGSEGGGGESQQLARRG